MYVNDIYICINLNHIIFFENLVILLVEFIKEMKIRSQRKSYLQIILINKKEPTNLEVCLDDEMISVRIVLFGLVVENSVWLVISREM
jgi:hypothetical protein